MPRQKDLKVFASESGPGDLRRGGTGDCCGQRELEVLGELARVFTEVRGALLRRSLCSGLNHSPTTR